MTRLSELQDILTSTPASPDSSTQNPVSLLRIVSYASQSHPASTSVLTTDAIREFLPCAETNWQIWKLPQVPLIYLSLTITSSFSRMQKAVPWKQLTQHHNMSVFYCTCRSEAQCLYRSSPITCFGWVLLVEGGCSILRSCSCAHVAFSAVFMPSSFCHTSITMSKNEASLFSSQLW